MDLERGEPSATVVADTVGCSVTFGVVPRYSVVDIGTILPVRIEMRDSHTGGKLFVGK